jgi:ABC-type amino acid transport substrate-binding protein
MKCCHYISSALLLWPLLFCQPVLAQRGADEVRVAHAQDFPPLAEVKDGKSEGLAVEILRAAAARSGLQVKFVAVPFEHAHITLDDGRADAAFPLAITPERRQLFDFTEGLLVTYTCAPLMCLPKA